MSKVSVCIPAYNQAVHLKRAIDSVLFQTYADYEIVITDDSPGDVVSDLVSAYNLTDRIKYFKNNSTLGSPGNWNEAIRKASGDYIKILHHDDCFNYDYSLAKYVQLLDENPGIDFAFSATQVVTPEGKDWVHQITLEQLSAFRANPLLLYSSNLVGAPSTTIIRKNAELQFDTNLKWLVDLELYLRQIKNYNIAYTPELLVATFVVEGRITDECIDNKEVEVSEYLYLLDKIFNSAKIYSDVALRQCLLKAISICDIYKIKNVQEIRRCGFPGNIHSGIKTYLNFNKLSPNLGKMYKAFLRRV